MFRFGIETEYLLYDLATKESLWHETLDFKTLYKIIENIQLKDSISTNGLDPEDAHKRLLPYVVEGYHIKDKDNNAFDMMPKGLEIRSPICESLEDAIETQKYLYEELLAAVEKNGYGLAKISHHPNEYTFDGPRCNRRHDFWAWAKEVMTTYGPDINISFPEEISNRLFNNKKDFEQKLNYYAPALTALSLNSPFYKGGLKNHYSGRPFKSIRTFRRSTIAPLIEWHANEGNRIEFKFFEMSSDWDDFEAYFLVCLGVSLCEDLDGRALDQERIYQMGDVALNGLDSDYSRFVIDEFMKKVPKVLESYGFSTDKLVRFMNRNETPADLLIKQFNEGKSISELITN